MVRGVERERGGLLEFRNGCLTNFPSAGPGGSFARTGIRGERSNGGYPILTTRCCSLRGFAPSRRRQARPSVATRATQTHTCRRLECVSTPLRRLYDAFTTPLRLTDVLKHETSGGENGFNQAIELSAETLANVKFVQEKRLLSQFFDQISQDTGKFCFGVRDTLSCLEMGAVETLIVYENLEITRLVFKTPEGTQDVKYLTKEQEGDGEHYQDPKTGQTLDVVEKMPMLEWLAENYKQFGCALEFVTNKSQEGSQFCRGFGGMGGVLRYAVDMADFEEEEFGNDDFYPSDSDDGWSTDPDI